MKRFTIIYTEKDYDSEGKGVKVYANQFHIFLQHRAPKPCNSCMSNVVKEFAFILNFKAFFLQSHFRGLKIEHCLTGLKENATEYGGGGNKMVGTIDWMQLFMMFVYMHIESTHFE